MGHDSMSVVDNRLKVYGIEKLRIADGSIYEHRILNSLRPAPWQTPFRGLRKSMPDTYSF